MASVYPGAFDAFSNPLPTDKRTNHAAQHGNVNDAVEAIQAVLGLSPAGGSGTVSARIGVVEGGVLSRVSGPGSSTDNALVRFDGTDGKTVQNSGITVNDSGEITSNVTINRPIPTFTVSGSATGSRVYIDAPAGTRSDFALRAGTAARWQFSRSATAESGSDVGSDLTIDRYSDAGSASTVLQITRSTGKVTLGAVGATAGLELGASGPRIMSGTGSPEGVVTAPIGSTWTDTTSAIAYFKQSGAGNTGWVGKFTTLGGTLSGDLTISKATPNITVSASTTTTASFYIDCAAAGSYGRLMYRVAGSRRWDFGRDGTAESGSNAGSDFYISSYTDASAGLHVPLKITRSTGKITVGQVGATAGLELGASGPRVMSGTGSPESVVTAPVGSTWTDTAATTGAIQWIKATGTGNTGWVVQYGDTGLRNLSGVTLSNSWTVSSSVFQLIRRGTQVDVQLWASKASASADAVYTLPVGFRPAVSYAFALAITSGSADNHTDGYVTSGGVITALRSGMSANGLNFFSTYTTNDAWPSSLPGTA